jgi:chromate transporter
VSDNLHWQLFAVFAPLSLLAVGGGQSVIPGIEAQVVCVHGWVTQQEFVELFAISRAAPGPGSLLSALIGWQVAGVSGAAVAALAFFLPSSLLAYAASLAWGRHRDSAWHGTIERGLAPIATGLILSGAFTVLRAASGSASVWIIAALAALAFSLRPRLNPLPVLLAAGIAQVAARLLF